AAEQLLGFAQDNNGARAPGGRNADKGDPKADKGDPKADHAKGDAKNSEQQAPAEKGLLSFLNNPSPEMIANLKKIESLKITRDENNPNGFHVDGNLTHPVKVPPPDLKVGGLGLFHKVTAKPQGTTIQKFDFNMSSTDHSVHISDAHGFNGTSSLTR